MTAPVVFKSSYFLRSLKRDLNPFTPNVLIIDEEFIKFKRRNWHLISLDTETLHFRNITGITLDTHLLGTTLTIKSTGNDPIQVYGFWKKEAREIKLLCSRQIAAYNQKSGEVSNTKGPGFSVADELTKLKKLVDEGVLTVEEFKTQKHKILNR